MAKLKFDRVIKITLGTNNSTTVPSDEVWKGTILVSGLKTKVNGFGVSTENTSSAHSIMLGGGSSIQGDGSFTGIAFKVIS